MPPNSTLLNIYDKITIGKCSYCFLCFRTESESKLNIPKPYLKSTTSLSTVEDINKKAPRICYMCERLAAAAAKYRKATHFATSIDKLFKTMIMSGKYQAEVRRLLQEGPVDPTELEKHKTLFKDEQELNSFRKTMKLQRTDILIVDSEQVFANEPRTQNSRTSPQSLKVADTVDFCGKTDCDMEVQSSAVNPPSNDIIVLDDDPPKHTTKTKHSTEATPRQIQSQHKKAKLKVKTEPPAHEEKDPPRLVPIEKLLKTPPMGTFGYLHPIVRKSDGTHIVPSLSAEIVNGQLKYQNQTVSEDLGVTNLLEIDNNNVTPVVDKNAVIVLDGGEVEAAVEKVLADKVGDIRSQSYGVNGQAGEGKVAREPVRKNDRIDWEDKIPMDVISFMDATDPHPPSFIKPLGAPVDIRIARTLTGGKRKNIHKKDEIIDLCSEN